MKLYRTQEKIYKQYWGEITVAIVIGNICVRSFVVSSTGAVWKSNNPDRDEWQGSTIDELKANEFTYTTTNIVYRDEAGDEYWRDEDGVWNTLNPMGEDLPANTEIGE